MFPRLLWEPKCQNFVRMNPQKSLILSQMNQCGCNQKVKNVLCVFNQLLTSVNIKSFNNIFNYNNNFYKFDTLTSKRGVVYL
jgi:hypothetical protein